MDAARLQDLWDTLAPYRASQQQAADTRHAEILAAVRASEERLMVHTAMLKAGLRALAAELQATHGALATPVEVRHVHVLEVDTPRPSGVSVGEHRLMQRYAWWTDPA